jgi:hypothetical protein
MTGISEVPFHHKMIGFSGFPEQLSHFCAPASYHQVIAALGGCPILETCEFPLDGKM